MTDPSPDTVEIVTQAADTVESRLNHDRDNEDAEGRPDIDEAPLNQPLARYSFAELLSDLDKQALLEFGRNII